MVRHLSFAALVLVASSVATFADTVITFNDNSVISNVFAIASASGTEIKTDSGNGISINFSCHLALQTVPPVGASNDTILSVGVLTTEGGSV